MAIGDQAGLEAVKELNAKTLPELRKILNETTDNAKELIELLDGATLDISIKLTLRKVQP